jgi:hypothetical protein
MFRFLGILIFLTILFASSCKAKIFNRHPLSGLWLSPENDKIWFQIEKERYPYLYPIGYFENCTVNDTSLVFYNPLNKKIRSQTQKIKCTILAKSRDNFMLLGPQILKRWFGLINGQLRDTLAFARTYPKNSGNFESIEFETSGCYGTCPEMKLKLYKNGAVFFEGIDYTEKNGYYSGRLTVSQMKHVKRILSYLSLNTLGEHYEAMWTDDETCNISIQTKDTVYKTSVYGFDKEPLPLRIFINELKELYKNIDMKKDSSHAYYDLLRITPLK